MYYVVKGFLWLISLLPLQVLYLFSEAFYGLAFYVVRYRKAVVLGNLQIAFPEKTDKERLRIAKQFYRNFIESFIESIKLLSMSRRQIEKHSQGDFEEINQLAASGKNIHVMAGHQFNWEFGNLLYALNLRIPFVGIYMPISNKILDRVFFNLRKRYGTILISAQDFKHKRFEVFSKQYTIGLAADQNPGDPSNAYWMNFMGKPAPFVTGPAKGAVRNNTAVMMIGFKKLKRGHYRFTAKLITEDGSKFKPEELTLKYKNMLEEIIREDPANYLWSHRRWKYNWKPEYGEIVG
jgi:KDO2-lipid IV(A) lauroyltransferase